MFLLINFLVFHFIILSDLNSNPNNDAKILFIRTFRFDCVMCLNISLIALKISDSSLSGSILTKLHQFLALSSFYFVVNISVAVSIFINFCCELIVMKI